MARSRANCSVCGDDRAITRVERLHIHKARFPLTGTCRGSGQPLCTCTQDDKGFPTWDDPACPAHRLPDDEIPNRSDDGRDCTILHHCQSTQGPCNGFPRRAERAN